MSYTHKELPKELGMIAHWAGVSWILALYCWIIVPSRFLVGLEIVMSVIATSMMFLRAYAGINLDKGKEVRIPRWFNENFTLGVFFLEASTLGLSFGGLIVPLMLATKVSAYVTQANLVTGWVMVCLVLAMFVGFAGYGLYKIVTAFFKRDETANNLSPACS